jgi:hypothetical protein
MKLPREFYIPAGATKVADKLSDAIAYLYTGTNGNPSARVFFGKQSKPVINCFYKTEANREAHVKSYFESRRAWLASKEKRRKEQAKPHTLEVGHILVSSWGYDQRNIDFYEVTKVIGANTVEIRALEQTRTGDGWTGKCLPKAGHYTGKAMRKKANGDGSVKIASYAWARIWDAMPEAWTAYA